MKNIILIVTSSIALAGSALAAGNQPAAPAQLKTLQAFAGQWGGAVVLEMGGQKMNLKGGLDCTSTSAGYGVTCQTRFSGLPGGATMEETDLFGYDPGSDTYHCWRFISSDDDDTIDAKDDGVIVYFTSDGEVTAHPKKSKCRLP